MHIKTDDDLDTRLVTVGTLGKFFGEVGDHQVERFAREGMPKTDRGSYPLLECVQWRLARAQESPTVEAARTRTLTAQAIKAETFNNLRAGELVELSLVSSTLDSVMAMLGTSLDGLGPRLAGTLATLDDAAKIQKVILDETRNLRRQAADQIAALGRAVADGGNPQTTTEPGRRPVGRRAPRPAARKPRTRPVAD